MGIEFKFLARISTPEDIDDLVNDVSSITSSSDKDDVNATTSSANVSCFSGKMVTWWDLSKVVFVY